MTSVLDYGQNTLNINNEKGFNSADWKMVNNIGVYGHFLYNKFCHKYSEAIHTWPDLFLGG